MLYPIKPRRLTPIVTTTNIVRSVKPGQWSLGAVMYLAVVFRSYGDRRENQTTPERMQWLTGSRWDLRRTVALSKPTNQTQRPGPREDRPNSQTSILIVFRSCLDCSR